MLTKQSEQSEEITEEGVVTVMKQRSCVHFDKRFSLNKLLENMKYCHQIKCLECKEGVYVKRASISKVNSGGNRFHSSAKKAIWLCLECGYSVCGEPTEPQSHVVRHIRLTRHLLVIHCENPKLRWCVPCNSLLSFEKEENGEKKDLLLEVVKLIRERYPNTSSAPVETHDSYSTSGSVTGEISLQGSVSRGIEEARDGYAIRGLVNLGNTCFFNSVLQNLLSLDQLREHFLKEDLSGGGGFLFSSLKRLFVRIKSEAGFFKRAINPIDFFGSVCFQAPQFRGYQQHDSHELLRCLLDGLSIEESSLREKKLGVSDSDNSSTHREPTLMDSVFGGEISSTVTCLECGHSSKVYEPFLDLSLPVPSKKPPSRMQQTFSQEKNGNIPQNKVVENGVISKDSETVSAKPESDKKTTVSILETPFALDLDNKQVSENAMVLKGNNVSDINTVTQGKGEVSLSSVSSHHEETKHHVEVYSFFDEPSVSCDDQTVRECEGEASSSDNHEQNIDYVDFSSFFDEPAVSEGPVFGLLSKAEVSEAEFMAVSDNVETVRAGEGEASSSFVSDNHEQNIDYVDFSSFFDEPEVSEGPVFGPPSKAEVSEAGLMAVSCNGKTVKASEGEASSLFVFGGNREQNIEYADLSSFFKGTFGPPSKADFMSVIWDSDSEVLDDSDSPVSVDRCLALFTKPEILSEDNAWHCENCSKKLKLQRLREKRKTKEGLGNGWVNENGAILASDLENGYKAAPVTGLPNSKEENISIDDDGLVGDSDTKQPSTATKTPILGGESTSLQQACNGNESEKSEDEAEDSEEVVVKTEATKRVLVNKAPPVLTIHLKRFSQDARGSLSKLSGQVDFKEFLDLSQYMDTRWTEEDQPVYRLAGLVEHRGTMRGGHYVAYIRGPKEKSNSDLKEPNRSIWYYASDYYVRRVSFEEVLHSEAYILFYQRI